MKRTITIITTLVITIGIDQWTKVLAVDHLKNKIGESYLDGFFRFIYAENTGAFLGQGDGLSPTASFWILKILPMVVLLGLLAYLFFSKELDRVSTMAFALIVGGGLSNVADRFLNNGAVVDFMNMAIGDLRTGIFNFADVFIMIGVGLMLVTQFWPKKKVEVESETVKDSSGITLP